MTQFCFTVNTALIVTTLNPDFSSDHTLFVTENTLSTGAGLPGRRTTNPTKSPKS